MRNSHFKYRRSGTNKFLSLTNRTIQCQYVSTRTGRTIRNKNWLAVMFFFLSNWNELIFVEDLINCKGWFQLAQYFQWNFFFVYWPIRNKNGWMGHVFYQIKTKWNFFVEDILNFLSVKFGSNWHCSLQEEMFSVWFGLVYGV